jgi:hypothetical protein
VKPPYATVTLTLSGGAIYVTETMIGSYHLWEGSANSVMFGFNTSQAVTISNISGSGSGTWSSTTSKSTGSNEFGTFSYAITNNATGDKGTTLSFKVTTTGGFTSVTQLVNPDAAGYTFVAQLKDACENKIGFAGASPQSVVPEPASIALLGSGLCALGGWIRKRRNKL